MIYHIATVENPPLVQFLVVSDNDVYFLPSAAANTKVFHDEISDSFSERLSIVIRLKVCQNKISASR